MDRAKLIGIPLHSLAKYRGMAAAVQALRKDGIADLVKKAAESFSDLGDIALSQIEVDSGPPNLRNFPQFLKDTDSVLKTAKGVNSDDFVFCLGGECTFVVGALAGFKSRFKGKPGMLWIDAHGDFNTPETTESGFMGGMPLAFACGRGPKLTPDTENARPLLDEENVVHVGSRSLDPLESKAMLSSPMRLYSASAARKDGIMKVAEQAADYLADRCDWITCHLDVDSIDPSIIPAVNFPEPDGLSLEDVRTMVQALKSTDKLKVFDLTAYNPLLDQNRESATKLLRLLAEIFPPRN